MTTITEITDDVSPSAPNLAGEEYPALADLLERSSGDGFAFLQTVFSFLNRKTHFFEDPEASKQLARLLKITKQSGQSGLKLGFGQKPQLASVPKPSAAQPSKTSFPEPPLPLTPPSFPAADAQQSVKIEEIHDEKQADVANDEDADPEPKGLVPTVGNGAEFDHYSFSQTLKEVTVLVPVPATTKASGCDVSVTSGKLRVGLKGEPPLLEGEFPHPVKGTESLWSLCSTKIKGADAKVIEITIPKQEGSDGMRWWASVLKGEPEIDVTKAEPEVTKLSEMDGDTRTTVEKMMFDQRQKAIGKPTSKEKEQQEILKKFMAAHPEMDFSNAKMM